MVPGGDQELGGGVVADAVQGQQAGGAGGHERDDQLIEALELAVEELHAPRQALLGELRAGPAAHDAHLTGPVACEAAARAASAGPGSASAPRPAQLKQVVHASADEVDVRVVESGDHAMPERVDHARTRPD